MRRNRSASILASSLLLLAPACGVSQGKEADTSNKATTQSLRNAIATDYAANLDALFKHFHANPELPLKETKTAKRLAEELRALGYEVTEGVGGTGIVAVLENGKGKTVLLRADMDGLPVQEKTDLPYASKVRQVDTDGVEKPVMHACGHDVHITSLVGAARQLASRKDEWSGKLVLIGQPAEELVAGAKAMLKDGLYERFPKPDYALAFHVMGGLEAGKLITLPGPIFSSAEAVDITVRGVATHGASPHLGVDPILVASHIVVGLQSIVARNVDPLKPGVITVGSFHGGSKHNIISDTVKLQLTIRADDNAVHEQLIAGIERTAKGIAQGLGVPDALSPIVERNLESTPVTINDETATRIVRTALETVFSEDRFAPAIRSGMGAEDFAYFAAPNTDVPGVYFLVGGAGAEGPAAGHHSPLFKVEPETSVKTGVEAMVVGAVSLFNAQ